MKILLASVIALGSVTPVLADVIIEYDHDLKKKE